MTAQSLFFGREFHSAALFTRLDLSETLSRELQPEIHRIFEQSSSQNFNLLASLHMVIVETRSISAISQAYGCHYWASLIFDPSCPLNPVSRRVQAPDMMRLHHQGVLRTPYRKFLTLY